jgi:hypothetical protein
MWPLEVDLAGGGSAHIVETDGDRVTLLSERAYPPGAPLEARAVGAPAAYQIKVRGSRRTGEDELRAFRVEGRFVNLSRSGREAILREKKSRDSSES